MNKRMLSALSLRLQQHAGLFPDKPAIRLRGRNNTWEVVTYRQLAERANLFSRGLAAYGIRPGTRAVLMTPPSVDFFALVFALLQNGVVSVMVAPDIGLRNVTKCIAETGAEVYFGSPLTHAVRRLFGWGRGSLRLNLTLADVARAGEAAGAVPLPPVEPESEAAIIYTSGSTGLPKGVVFTQDNFSAQIEMLAQALQLHGDEIDLPTFPLFVVIDCLLGVTAIVPDMRFPPPAKVDPVRLVDAIRTWQVQTMFVSPVALARLTRHSVANRLQFPGLQKVITAGAPAPLHVQEQFVSLLADGAELFGIYGSTETLPVSIVSSHEILQETRALSAQGAGVCIGRPVHGAQVRIIPISEAVFSPEEASTLPVGEIGEITVQGRAVTRAYVAREQANRLAKIITEEGETIHRMGDLGYFDEKGRLWYCGRKSQRVHTAAGTLFTEPVEGIFNVHPLVYRTALVSVEKAGQTEPVLWVELIPEARNADKDNIRGELFKLAKSHSAAQQIETILFHPAFPTDARHNSKIIREKLARQAQALQ